MENEAEQKYIEAGRIAGEVREQSRDVVKAGMTLLEIAEKIEAMIKEKGGDPAFPVNISINDVAAHFTPSRGETTALKHSDIAKIDLGVHIDGYVADTALTVFFDEKHKALAHAAESALKEAVKHVFPGAKISDISASIEKTIRDNGFKPVSNLTGHGINRYDLHSEPTIPNVSFHGDQTLEEDEVIAIEPFATDGAGYVKDSEQVFIYSMHGSKPVRNMDARKIIEYAETRNGLPFAERWLPIDSMFKIRLALRELRERGVLHDYNVLKEGGGGLVSQAEHSIIVREKPVVLTK